MSKHLNYHSNLHSILKTLTASGQSVVANSLTRQDWLVARALRALMKAPVIGKMEVKVTTNPSNLNAAA